MTGLLNRLTVKQQRFLEGCYYIGCFTPLAFSALALLIIGKAIYDGIVEKQS